jgi:sugar/nucleoside kinase (ribokinase family)
LLTFVGAATWDALALVERYPGPDERVVATDLAQAGGGPAATAAVAAARLGHQVAFVGAVGDDAEGERIVADLQAEGIDTSGVLRLARARSAASLVVVSTSTSTRAIVNRPLAPTDLTGHRPARDLLQASRWVHVDHIGWAPVTALSAGLASPLRLSFDGGHQVPGFSPTGLALYVPTVEALQTRYGDRPVDDLLRSAEREGAQVVVATRGPAGSVTLQHDRLVQVPAVPVDVVSTLGAGDVFHGALLAAVADDRPLPEAMRRANAVAALSCRALDGRSAVPTASELEDFLAAQPPTMPIPTV